MLSVKKQTNKQTNLLKKITIIKTHRKYFVNEAKAPQLQRQTMLQEHIITPRSGHQFIKILVIFGGAIDGLAREQRNKSETFHKTWLRKTNQEMDIAERKD
jgi:hypothetical protein